MAPSAMVRLRNGSVEFLSVVETWSKCLQCLLGLTADEKAKDKNLRRIAMFESLVMRCRDPLFVIDKPTEDLLLKGEYLCCDHQPNPTFRNIVLASSEGELPGIRYVNPIVSEIEA